MKIGNGYASAIGQDVFEACPKAVLAAIAVSALTQGGDYIEEARARLLDEWRILHQNGIVTQPVPAKFRVESEALAKRDFGETI